MIVDYFLADNDTAAAAALTPEGIPGRDQIDGHGIEPSVKLAALQSLLTHRDYDAIMDGGRAGDLVASKDDYEALVLTVTDELRDALAAADESTLREVAEPWSRTEENVMERRKPKDLAEFLILLADLAKRAGPGQRIYAEVHV